jgi:hypothetical protein
MKFRFLTILVASLLLAAGSAAAGNGGPSISGTWVGDGEAMYVDGTSATIVMVAAELEQDGNFFYGVGQFDVEIGGQLISQFGQMSGYISGNAVKGIMGGCFTLPPDCAGAAVLEGKLSGNKMTGTVVDFSDGSVSYVTMHRMDF